MSRSKKPFTSFLFGAALAWCAPALAQDELPAVSTGAGGNEQPAVQTAPAAPAVPGVKTPRIGTEIVGERESPIGLFITPWKDSGAESELERPARLLQEELVAIDEDVFIRNLEYYEALSGALKTKKAVTPPTVATPSGSPAAPSAGGVTSAPAPKP